MVSPSLTNAYNRTEIEKLVTHRTWKSTLRGQAVGRGAGLWHTPLLEIADGLLQMSTLCRLLIREFTVGRPRGRQIVYHCDSAAVSECAHKRLVSVHTFAKPCRPPPATQKGAEAVMLWKSSARLSTAAFIRNDLDLQVRMVGDRSLLATPNGVPFLSPLT